MGRTLPRDSASYNQQVAERGEGVTYINNTTVAGDDYYASPNERVIIVDNDSTYTQNIFLPAVGESIGQILTILFPDFGGGGTVADQDDSQGTLWTDLSNDADNEFCVVYNTGVGWVTIATDMV